MFTAGGGLLAVAGLAATMAIGPAAFADDAVTTANAEVASTITLTGDAAFTLAGAPGVTATGGSGLTATSNNSTGYNITVTANQATLAGTGTNPDTIPVISLQVADSSSTLTALSTTVPVTVHTQATKSADGGDAVTANYSLAMPWVTADTYSGGLTFTAAAND